jgi:nicotinamide-nucleotide amidase
MIAIVLSIGDELVLGQTVDTNSAWLSNELASIGWQTAAHATVGDDQGAIEAAIREAAGRCDALVISGGLGPTKDDLTRFALAQVLGEPLEMNDDWLRRMGAMFRLRGRAMAESNRSQAMIPRGARVIENSAGTAAGIDAEIRTIAPTQVASQDPHPNSRQVGTLLRSASNPPVYLERGESIFAACLSCRGCRAKCA